MKKWIKGFAIAGVVLLCMGTGITGLAAAMGGAGQIAKWYTGFQMRHESYSSWEEEKNEEMNLITSYKGTERMELEVKSGVVQIVENQDLDDEIRIYEEKEKSGSVDHQISSDGKEVFIQYDGRGNGNSHIEGKIEIPVGYKFSRVRIEADGGVVKVSGLSAEELELDIKQGMSSLSFFSAKNLEVNAFAGEIEAKGEVLNELKTDLKAGKASFLLTGKENEFNYDLESKAGHIRIGLNDYAGLLEKKQIFNGASKKADLTCNAATVEIDFSEEE